MTAGGGQSATMFDDLKTRSIVGVALAAVAFLFFWLGGFAFTGFMAVLTGIMLAEVTRLTKTECNLEDLPRLAMIVLGGLSVLALGIDAFWFLVLASFGILIAATINQKAVGPLTVAGYATVVFGSAAAVYLRGADSGLILLSWIVLCVAAADIGGYMFGRSFQGPKLLPSISPKKTWSGFLGGLVLAILVSLLFAAATGASYGVMLMLGAVVSIVSVMGDLMESSVKRKFGVKDAGNILPGHGGLLDRLDGMTMVMLLMGGLAMMIDLGPVVAPVVDSSVAIAK